MNFTSMEVYKNEKAQIFKDAARLAHDIFHPLQKKTSQKSFFSFKTINNNIQASEAYQEHSFTLNHYLERLDCQMRLKKETVDDHTTLCLMLFWSSIEQNCLPCAEYFLEADLKIGLSTEALLNQNDIEGLTALHIAAKNANQAFVDLILQHTSRMTIINGDTEGKIPLYHALLNGADLVVLDRLGFNQFMLIPEGITQWNLLHFIILNYLSENRYDLETLKQLIKHLCNYASGAGQILFYQKDDKKGYTPLHMAVYLNYFDAVALLIEKGANPDTLDYKGYSPLHTAISDSNLKVAKLLLDYSADPNTYEYANSTTPLYTAILNKHFEVVQLLLQKGANPNISNRQNGTTPLHLAVQYQNCEIIKSLLEKGAHINATDDKKRTPLHTAIYEHSVEIMQLLILQGADCNTIDYKHYSPLHTAIYYQQIDIVQLLLEQKIVLNSAENYPSPLHTATHTNQLTCIKLLLDKGANSNALDHQKRTPLHLAICEQHPEIANLLLQHKDTQLDIQDEEGLTPLHTAIIYDRDNVAFFDQLLDKVKTHYSHIFNLPDNDGYTPIHLTVLQSHSLFLAKFLTKRLEFSTLKNYQNDKNILHTAIECESVQLIKQIITRFSVDIVQELKDSKDSEGNTPLALLGKKKSLTAVLKNYRTLSCLFPNSETSFTNPKKRKLDDVTANANNFAASSVRNAAPILPKPSTITQSPPKGLGISFDNCQIEEKRPQGFFEETLSPLVSPKAKKIKSPTVTSLEQSALSLKKT